MADGIEEALNPERFALKWRSGKLTLDPEGELVRWSDFAALRALALTWRDQRDGYRSDLMRSRGQG